MRLLALVPGLGLINRRHRAPWTCYCLLAACKIQPREEPWTIFKLGEAKSQGVTRMGRAVFTRLMQIQTWSYFQVCGYSSTGTRNRPTTTCLGPAEHTEFSGRTQCLLGQLPASERASGWWSWWCQVSGSHQCGASRGHQANADADFVTASTVDPELGGLHTGRWHLLASCIGAQRRDNGGCPSSSHVEVTQLNTSLHVPGPS